MTGSPPYRGPLGPHTTGRSRITAASDGQSIAQVTSRFVRSPRSFDHPDCLSHGSGQTFRAQCEGRGRCTACQAVARPSEVDDRRHKIAIAERSTCRSEAISCVAAQLAIGEHHIYDIWPPASWGMRWPRRTRRLAWLTPRGQRPMPAPEPGEAGRFPRSRTWCFRLADGALHQGGCQLGTGSRQRERVPALTWCPGGCGRGISYRSSTATRTHGCGGMEHGRSGCPRWSWGTVGARTEGIQRSAADSVGKRMPW
jgi:hypothetical protein